MEMFKGAVTESTGIWEPGTEIQLRLDVPDISEEVRNQKAALMWYF